VAGIIAAAVGDDLLLAAPRDPLTTAGIAMVLGGPALYLVGESLFRLRMTATMNPRRLVAVAVLVGLAALAPHVSALALAALVCGLLAALALTEWRAAAPAG
jgi:low temperature requirement protein LtrA